MADYRPIPDTEVDPDAPVTSELAYAFRDNPIAIAEGAAGAPKVNGRALDVYLGYLYVNSRNAVGFTGLGSVSWLLAYVCGSTASSPLQARYSSDGGVAFGAWQNFSGAVGSLNGIFRFNLSNGQWRYIGSAEGSPRNVFGTHAVPSSCNAIQFRIDIALSTILDMDFEIHGGVA